MSQLVKHVLKTCFFNEQGYHFERGGLTFNTGTADFLGCKRLFARHEITIADFCALRAVLTSMGQNGLKPCPSCTNITKDDVADGVSLLCLSNLDFKKCDRHTDHSVRELQAYLREEKSLLSKTAFQELESRLGYHFSEASILNDTALAYKSMSTLRYDWPHIYFITGLFGKDMDAFMHLSKSLTPQTRPGPVTYIDLDEYLCQWTWLARFSFSKSIFERDRMTATASEQLGAAPVISTFFTNVVLAEPALHELLWEM